MITNIRRCSILFSALGVVLGLNLTVTSGASGPVRFEKGVLEVPTYTFSRSLDVPPLFQIGNSKGAYPYAALDRTSLSPRTQPVRYESLTLENEYLRIVILPELGGRLWSAWSKLENRELFYQPGIVKPSSYNHRGGWPVGNLEVYGPFDAHMLTWPGEPWPWAQIDHADGSKTIVLSHIEHFFRNKVYLEITLRPGFAAFETTVRLHNRYELPNRYLLWTNAGIPATEGTRFIYPMTKTIGHDSAEFGDWPVFEGVDLSWYRNNQTMLGVFGLDIYDDFIAGYEMEQDFGTVRYADRRIARGIKTWTWGTGKAGQRHLPNYTDSGVPYIEVQSGRFVWDGNYEFINPGESDGWTETWYGVRGLGDITTANHHAALNLDSAGSGVARLRLAPLRNYPSATLSVSVGGEEPRTETVALQVGQVFQREISVPGGVEKTAIKVELRSSGRLLIAYQRDPANPKTPEFASDSIPRSFGPLEQLTAEEAFQKGLTHEKLGQLGEAESAYRAAVAKDQDYTQPNLRLGLLALSRFEPGRALEHFNRALTREPSNGEAHYYAAIAREHLGEFAEARRHYYRLLPSSAFFGLRDLGLGILALREGDAKTAVEFLQSAVNLRPAALTAGQAYLFALRKTGLTKEAAAEADRLLAIDPTSAFAASEKALLAESHPGLAAEVTRMAGSNSQGFIELATEYAALGGWKEAVRVLEQGISSAASTGEKENCELSYLLAFALHRSDRPADARTWLTKAAKQDPSLYIFPFRRETIDALEWAHRANPEDANAAALLGGILYSRTRKAEAFKLWESASLTSPHHFLSLRNLGWAMLQEGDSDRALPYLEAAAGIRNDDLEIVAGLSQIYTRLNRTKDALRLAENALAKQPGNDQLKQLLATAQASSGDSTSALKTLAGHQFGPTHQSYTLLNLYQAVCLLRSLELMQSRQFEEAAVQIEAGLDPPANLGADDFVALASSRLLFFKALALETAGKRQEARESWVRAAETSDTDFNGEGLFRILAMRILGKGQDPEVLQWLEDFRRVNRLRKLDSALNEKVRAYYLSGLLHIMDGKRQEGIADLAAAQDLDQSDLSVRHARLWLEAGFFASGK